MMHGIDISAYQKGLNVGSVVDQNGLGFVIVKATEGTYLTQSTCDPWIQALIKKGTKWGFYHVMTNAGGKEQAEYFVKNCKGYFGHGIPILDVEGYGRYPNDPQRAMAFMSYVKAQTGITPILYCNRNCLNTADWSGVANFGCGLWIANYPKSQMTFSEAEAHTDWMSKSSPFAFAAMWQFGSTSKLKGWNGNLDVNLFFGNTGAWDAYAGTEHKTPAVTEPTRENPATPSGSKWLIARDVIDGKYGNGDTRRNRLGTRFDEIQAAVNTLLKGPNETLATAAIRGELGNGETRKKILGERYAVVQAIVNKRV